ncbi:hypothetical protein [Fulvivirga sedimenti]|uniref:WG repeat-containing protein n=1 Tax=Fulvivirga sedimenti TaxID=2879465 RepID=A0A9X1KVS0_9BACT|nr:hypothetical protein [Fulvivirga sedimenti]MCA6073985.1 hypothetical protein [Fulvivirga sedimenti]
MTAVKSCFFSFLVLLSSSSIGQNLLPVNQTYQDSDIELFNRYSQSVNGGAAIYNGPEYKGADPTIAGHPYFLNKNFQFGSVQYMGYTYDSLIIGYNIVQDQLILVYPRDDAFFAIVPRKDRINYFSLLGHHFVQIKDLPAGLPDEGFYDVLYDGTTKILARRSKIQAAYQEGNYLFEYKLNDQYFLWKDGRFHTIRTRAALYQLFKEDKREIKKFIRDENIDFKTYPDGYFQKLGPYLDQLQLK